MKYSAKLSALLAWLAFIIAAVLLFTACSPVGKLSRTGTYTVDTVYQANGANIVKLKGIRQTLVFITDTLKPGDKVFVTVLKDTAGHSKKLNVFTTN